MLKLVYPAIFVSNAPESGYTVSFPDLPGCITFGDNDADAILMAQDAACGWILGELEDGRTIPKASDPGKLTLGDGEFLTMLVLDISSYAEKYGTKSVRKNTTIPAFLDTFGQAHQVNYSKLLTDALMQMYLKNA